MTLGAILGATRFKYFADSRLFSTLCQSCWGAIDSFEYFAGCVKIGLPLESDENLEEYLTELAFRATDANPSCQLPPWETGEAELELGLSREENSSAASVAHQQAEGEERIEEALSASLYWGRDQSGGAGPLQL